MLNLNGICVANKKLELRLSIAMGVSYGLDAADRESQVIHNFEQLVTVYGIAG